MIRTGADEARILHFLEAVASAPEPNGAHHSMFLVAEFKGRQAAALVGTILLA